MCKLKYFAIAGFLVLGTTACDDSTGPDDDIDLDTGIELQMIADGLMNPVMLAEVPDESGRLFVLEQPGLIRVITSEGTLLEEPFLDVRDRIVDLMLTYDERGC